MRQSVVILVIILLGVMAMGLLALRYTHSPHTTGSKLDTDAHLVQVLEVDALALSLACTGCHIPETRPENRLGTRPETRSGTQMGASRNIYELSRAEILNALETYRANPDGPTVMHRLMQGYSEAEMNILADYFAKSEASMND